MCHIVHPSLTLLHPDTAPLRLRHQMVLGNQLHHLFWQYHMPENNIQFSNSKRQKTNLLEMLVLVDQHFF